MRRLAAAALLVALAGCASSGQPDIATLASNSDQLIYEEGRKALEKKNWEPARQHFKRIIDGFPQSRFGPDARLGLGDSYFREGGSANYILAVSAYREFLTFYPSHPRSDYAQFQVGESFYKDRNSSDRDQTPNRNALEEYQRLLEVYPQTSLAEEARARILELRQGLARHDFLVGYFYQRTRQSCRSAIPRYEEVIKSFPDYAQTDEVLFRLSECLAAAGRGYEALPHLTRLLQDYPQSTFLPAARELQPKLPTTAPPTPAPSPSPSPAPVP